MIVYDILDKVVGVIADALGKPADQLRLVVCFLFNIVLAIIMNTCVPQIVFIRHLYSAGMGLMLLIYLYPTTIHHVFTMAYPVYLLMWLAPRKK